MGVNDDPDRKRLYSIWETCRKRTMNPRNKDYRKYGARGIRMCREWAEDFEAFREWAMAHGYRDGLTMDRVNNNKGYEPGNVRWISRKAQARNRTTNTYLTVDGKSMKMVEWVELYGVPDYVIVKRLQAGWDVKDAVTIPAGSCRNYKRMKEKRKEEE